ncbi:hypothetical protein FEM48_Zijuj12G0139300 [Ziziphus jujuba var. spinosa]|uniref:RING-type E3 ubiquitin transferase n=1 Tax=Ziziphus jujuba var. spinosa TaxID=714518 RepID=A0A978UDQ8_ZIZJJ|nr:hypothetical protein FEM48_Zijuj12G0139300 [Ziziphus jujuba var. spinosa]
MATQALQFSEFNTAACREVGVSGPIGVQFDLDEVLNMSAVDDVVVIAGELSESNRCSVEMANMPTVITTEHDGCTVCMEGFQSSEGGKQVPCCGHVFHAACISTWLSLSNSCPLCRFKY